MEVPEALRPFARPAARGGSALFYYDTGPAGDVNVPAVLLVHGLGDEADTWQSVLPILGRERRVIAPDLPGFGRSPLPPRRFLGPVALSRTLAALLERLGLADVVCVGSSLGGLLVQLLALQSPRLVRALVLVDGGLLPPAPLPWALLMMMLPVIGERRYHSLASRPDAAYATLAPYYASLDSLPAAQREFLRARVAERVSSSTQQKAYLATLRRFVMWTALRQQAAARRARALNVPTLYLWGSDDRIMPASLGRAASGLQPGSKSVQIDGAGHLPHQERPAEFLSAVDSFLSPPRYPVDLSQLT
jgi:pimeloyl-ACP methyl ester carboxylesterase